MVKKRVLDPIPVLDENLLSEALRGEGIKEVCKAGVRLLQCSSSVKSYGRGAPADAASLSPVYH